MPLCWLGGAHLKGFKTQALWKPHHQHLHINVLELLAVKFALQAFLPHVQGRAVLVRTDNTTVLQYLNKMGGTKSPQLCQLTWELLTWCIAHKITLSAEHIAGVDNVLADRLSRHLLPTIEWELNDRVVQALFSLWTSPQVDLFATSQNRKLPRFCSLRYHPQAWAVNALDMTWDNLYAYAFPPLPVLRDTLLKIRRERVVVLLVAPLWTRREWYNLLLGLLIDYPCRLPILTDLVTQDNRSHWHPNPAEFSLVGCLVSGIPTLQEAFQQRLLRHALPPENPVLSRTMTQAGSIFLPGVREPVLIPLCHLLV